MPALKHGMARTPEYAAWHAMTQRCTDPRNPRYHAYGGRGIRICRRWMKFENFFADMGARPQGMTLERKNNDGDYTPSNCIWASYSVQNRNRRIWKQKGAASKYRGVIWDGARNKWRVDLWLNGRNINCGRFESEEEAAAFAERKRKEYGLR